MSASSTVVLLVLVLVAGHEVGGAKRWLRVGGLGVQPSEFAKLAVVLVLADYLDRRQSRLTRWSGFLPPLIVTGFVLGLILLERDLGTPFLIGCVAFSLIAMAGAKWRHLFLVGLATIPGLFLALSVPYRRQRLLAFLDPWKESQGVGYQLVQSLMALGSGGFWGKGSGESTIKMYYMPESQTDFIFPIFGEEFGFQGRTRSVNDEAAVGLPREVSQTGVEIVRNAHSQAIAGDDIALAACYLFDLLETAAPFGF